MKIVLKKHLLVLWMDANNVNSLKAIMILKTENALQLKE